MRSTTSTGGKPGGGPAIYESARAVNEYLAFHFLDPKVRPLRSSTPIRSGARCRRSIRTRNRYC